MTLIAPIRRLVAQQRHTAVRCASRVPAHYLAMLELRISDSDVGDLRDLAAANLFDARNAGISGCGNMAPIASRLLPG